MIGDGGPSGDGYAQIGIMFEVAGYEGQQGCNCMTFFYEWNKTGNLADLHFGKFGGTPVDALSYKVRVVWNNDSGQDGKLHMQHDFNGDGVWSEVAETSFDPGVWWDWRIPIYSTETSWLPSDLMGTSSQRHRFEESLIRQGAAGSSFIDPLFITNASSYRTSSPGHNHPDEGLEVAEEDKLKMWDVDPGG
jgi:hypothetical protein